MQTFTGIAEARDAAQEFFFSNRDKFPDHVVEAMRPLFATGTSPVDAVVNFTEIVFANRSDVPKAAHRLAAGLAELATANGFHDYGKGRGLKLQLALRRTSGEKAPEGRTWPAKDDDPEPVAHWKKPEPVASPGPDTIQ